jgi:hypothetical protein
MKHRAEEGIGVGKHGVGETVERSFGLGNG